MASSQVAVGAVGSTSAIVTSRIAGTVARLAVSEQLDLSGAVFFETVSTSSDGIHKLSAEGLVPDTDYFYAVEDNGVLDTSNKGRFHTHGLLGSPWSHTVAWIGDAGLVPDYPGSGSEMAPTRVSNHPCFTNVKDYKPALQVHVGDVTYYDPGSGVHTPDASLTTYRRMWTDTFNQSRQRDLYRDTPTEYVWDDHDYGPNDSDGTHTGKANAAQAARERWPHYPMGESSGAIYRAWQMGRIQHVLLDTRYYRTPNSEPDGPGKTMLGSAQKDWLEDILRTSTAEVLILTSPTPWVGGLGGDTWNGFLTERAWLGALLVETGWAPNKMVFATGDIHHIGVGDGTTTPDGGFPILNTGSIDANYGAATRTELNLFHQAGRNQWTSIEVTDTGESITLRLLCWVGSTVVFSYDLLFDTPTTPPAPPPAPPLFAVAAVKQEVTWLAVNRVSGTIIAELPEVECKPRLQLSAFASTSLSIPLSSDANSHVPIQTLLAATDGRIGAIVAVVNDIPIWMGLPANRDRGSGPKINVPSANTPESYLFKRFARDVEFVNADRSRVALALAMQAESLNGLGQGLGFEYDVEDTGELITIGYKTTDKVKIYEAIRALCAQGMEFTTNLDWGDGSQTRVSKVLKIARRIGVLDAPNMPVLDTDVSVVSYRQPESWADEDYANYVTAIGPGQGDAQPSKTAIDHSGLAFGYPLVESVIMPGNNIGDSINLQAFADSDLNRRKTGVDSLEIKASLYEGPLPCVHARIGDMLGHHLNGPGHPKPTVYDPTDYALVGSGRLTGIEIDPVAGTWTPGLVEDPTLEAA